MKLTSFVFFFNFRMGGDPGALTLPNLISHYSPVVGASVHHHRPSLTYWKLRLGDYRETDNLNAGMYNLFFLLKRIKSIFLP